MNELDIAGMEAMVGAVEASTYSQKVTMFRGWLVDDRRLCRDCAKAAGWDR